MVRTKNNRLIMQSKCSACRIKKSRFVKVQEAKGLLNWKERIEKFMKKYKKKKQQQKNNKNKQTLFIKMNLIKLVFNMIWLMANQKI